MPDVFRLAVLQMRVGEDKSANLEKASKMIKEASSRGARAAVLPEIFNSPYQAKRFPDYAEPLGGPTTLLLSELAAQNGIMIVGGSIPERGEDGCIYNTSFVFGSHGELLGRHRKIHLFDIDIPGKMTFKESTSLSPGRNLSVFRYDDLCFSVLICYDVRFPELSRLAAMKGAQIIIIPAAFNRTTGPLHWELLMRSRALDNQVFVAAASPSLNRESSYWSWGHSMIVDPWGKIVAAAGDQEELIIADLELSALGEVRTQIPVLQQRRDDLYKLSWVADD